VNSAAISYYFRSKDALMGEALAMTLENAFGDWEVLLREKSGDLRPRIGAILMEVLEGSLKFPGIVKAHLYDTFINGSGRTAFIRRFTKFLSSMTREMAALFPDRSVREIGADAIQMVSAVLLPGILPQLYRHAIGIDLSRADGRVAYVDSLMEHFFPIAPSGRTV
jgi:AcrR family transcriptional regulator